MNNQTIQIQSKHTPGPWVAQPGSNVSFVIKAGDKRSIAAIAGTINRPVEEKRRNALLIAASPELFAACDALLDATCIGAPDPQGKLNEAIALAHRAIAKAVGN